MNSMVAVIRSFLRRQLPNTRGANMVEYLIVVGVVAMVGMVAFQAFGSSASGVVQSQKSKIDELKK